MAILLKSTPVPPIPGVERKKRFRSVPCHGGAAMFEDLVHLAWSWPDLFWWLR